MSSYFLIIVSLACSLGPFPFGVAEAVTNQQSAPAAFTDQDLMNYRNPAADTTGSVNVDTGQQKGERGKKTSAQKEQEYWCKKGTRSKRKIEKTRDEVQAAQEELSGLKDAGNKKKKAAAKTLEKARKRLADAESTLAELEDEAHRKGIPPGWLRCQFTW